MSLNVSRAVLRRSVKLPGQTARRFESTTSKAADAAKDTTSKASQAASDYKSKASQGLSRVSSSAGPAISGAAKGLVSSLGKIGGRTGRLIAFIERQIPPTIHYARVGLELSRLVFQGQKMAPPPASTFQSYYQNIIKSLRNPGQSVTQFSNSLQQLRNVDKAGLASGAVLAGELLGFFTVGEVIGKMKLIGYRGDTEAHH